jgi:hypothetical protein
LLGAPDVVVGRLASDHLSQFFEAEDARLRRRLERAVVAGVWMLHRNELYQIEKKNYF